MTTPLTKPVSRAVQHKQGDIVVTIADDGVTVRARGKQKGVFVPYDNLVQLGIQLADYMLAPSEHCQPFQVLATLRHRQRAK
jgi:hypothetical protein